MTNDTKTQHTPGPWSVKHGEVLFGDQSRQPKGAQETIICDPSAGCYYADGKRKCLPIDEREANARLIAAAPELLEAAKDALKSMQRLPDVEGAYRQTCISQLSAAIAKAEVRA